MGKLSRPPILVFFKRHIRRRGKGYVPESRTGYLKRYEPDEGEGEGAGIVTIDEQGVIWPPSSEVLYTRAIRKFLTEQGLLVTAEDGSSDVNEDVLTIWVPFPHGSGEKEWPNGRPKATVGPAANFPGWDFFGFDSLAELERFLADKSKPFDPDSPLPAPPGPLRDFLPGEKRLIESVAKKVGMSGEVLRKRIRDGKSVETVEAARNTPAPNLTKTLLDRGVPIGEILGKVGTHKASFDKLASELGVKRDWLVRVLHGKYTSERLAKPRKVKR